MLPKVFNKIKSNIEIVIFSILVIFTAIFILINHNNSKIKNEELFSLINNIYLKKTLNFYFDHLKPKLLKINHTISNGDTLDKIFFQYSANEKEIKLIKSELKKHVNFENIRVNEVLEITIDQTDNRIINFSYPISKSEKIILTRKKISDEFLIEKIKQQLVKKIVYKENTITSSLYKAASDKNIPDAIIIEFARIYGFQIDFQRDIRKNDNYQIMYEAFFDKSDEISEIGDILYTNLTLSGIKNELFLFRDDKFFGHYDENGKSIIKTLMKTPINGARLSSSFGMRKHPIDGFNKMHKGTDFAAPTGTPIMASGDGIITKTGWCGGGGNCVKIKHNSVYQTVYAHMSKFAYGIKKGLRVKQGQTIGYVGSTGKSTGPHLHYEVIVNGKRVNSQTLKLPSGKILKKDLRKKFETQKIKLKVLKSEKIIGIS